MLGFFQLCNDAGSDHCIARGLPNAHPPLIPLSTDPYNRASPHQRSVYFVFDVFEIYTLCQWSYHLMTMLGEGCLMFLHIMGHMYLADNPHVFFQVYRENQLLNDLDNAIET